jgi:tetratricopeptide (TPR) repeat protein
LAVNGQQGLFMPSQDNFSPKDLPLKDETWQLSIRPLSGRSIHTNQTASQMHMLMLTDLDNELVLATEMFQNPPDITQLQQILFQAMIPDKQDARQAPHRPQKIQCDNAQQVQVLQSWLAEIGVQAEFTSPDEDIDQLFAEIETLFQNEINEIPGLLTIEGVTVDLAGNLFAAAASFYRAAPWKNLSDDQPLAVKFPDWGKQGYIQLMGNAGLEFGLVLFWRWEDLVGVYQFSSDPLAHLPESGWRALSFESLEALPPSDQQALKEYGWKVAGKRAYPLPAVFTPNTVERPDRQELLVYTVLLRAVPRFISESLLPDEEGDFLPGHGQWTIQTHDGPVKVEISYPAGDLSLEIEPSSWDLDEDKSPLDEFLSTGQAGTRKNGEATSSPTKNSPIYKDEKPAPTLLESDGLAEVDHEWVTAKRLMYRAWEQVDPEQRILLARQALAISAHCAEAYELLAEEDAQTLEEACIYYRKAVQAEEERLGEAFFAENASKFWEHSQTRLYLRAKQGLADCLERLGKGQEALELYRDLLILNPNDNQGARYALLVLLLRLKRDEEALALLQAYPQDASAAWSYSRALVEFRLGRASPRTEANLDRAIRDNPFVIDYLCGNKPIPTELPPYTGFGDESEAIHFAVDHFQNWWSTSGAIDWLRRRLKTFQDSQTLPKPDDSKK